MIRPPITDEMLDAGGAIVEAAGIMNRSHSCHMGGMRDTFIGDLVGKVYKAMSAVEKWPEPDPEPTFASSVGVGFAFNRTDALVALHLGGTHTFMAPTEAFQLARLLDECAYDAEERARARAAEPTP